jgi:catechol 2,3-dioxygenase-like lactoylglutathione lyase family enzyme
MNVGKLSVWFEPDLGDAVRSAAAQAGKPVSSWLAEAAATKLGAEALSEFVSSWEAEHRVQHVSAPGGAGNRHNRSWNRSAARALGTITRVSVQLNHTIVSCRDQQRSAAFLTGILGLPTATRFAHFLVVEADNGVSLDFAETTAMIAPQHYAFLVGEEEFDAAFRRIRDQAYWADPGQTQPQVINRRDSGRGLYFEDPDRHLLEIITRPYGSAR